MKLLRWLKHMVLRVLLGKEEADRLCTIAKDPLNRSPASLGVLPGCDLLGMAHGESRIQFVSRHGLVESGIYWEKVANKELVAKPGEYYKIKSAVLPSTGEVVEVIHHAAQDVYLVASPDTDHGDHILMDKIRKEQGEEAYRLFLCECNKFVRRDPMEIVRERLGADLQGDGQHLSVEASDQPIDESTIIPIEDE